MTEESGASEPSQAPTEEDARWFEFDPTWDPRVLVNELLSWAIARQVTDLHLSPHSAGQGVRARLDGELQDVCALESDLFRRAVARVKVLAEADLAEHRRPQDGRFTVVSDEQPVDFRASFLPTMHGESVVLRLLNRAAGLMPIQDLGMTRAEVARLRSLLTRRGGLIAVTGPAGVGKTTTLYAALLELAGPERSVITIEDPVEYEIPRSSQTAVHPHLGNTFASLLRAVLRQDPDVILVGEVRDAETAEVVVRAALTGHLVLTSLHTRRAADAVVALRQYGVPAYALAPALCGVIAQQLVRKVCPDCRETIEQGEEILANPEFARVLKDGERPTFSFGTGCERCLGRGYRGRRGVFEVMEVDESVRRLVYEDATAEAIEGAAVAAGMLTLQEKGYRAVVDGITTVEEVVRVLSPD